MLRTPLYDWHVARGGRMVEFGGWEMPIQYTSITEEHHAVRRAAGLFDIAHMGRIMFSGPDAATFLDRLLTNDVPRLKTGQVRYSLVCNEQGGILDDVLIYRFASNWMLVVNASNRTKILNWIETQRTGFDVEVHDRTSEWFMLALQGPRSLELLQPQTSAALSAMKYYTTVEADIQGAAGIISRTGYTGEDGFEVIVPNAAATALWTTLIDKGHSVGLVPCGLGCRDTLRLEAAMPLYGHEMDESTDPFTAGLDFGVKLDAGDFIGRAALVAAKARTDRPVRVGLKLEGKRIAREGSTVVAGGQPVGRVTSGTFSPTLEASIAMGYVPANLSQPGTHVDIDIRGKVNPAVVTKLPFHKRQQG